MRAIHLLLGGASAFALGACASGSSGLGTASTGGGGAGSDTGAQGSDAGVAPAGDSLPASAVSFFQGGACPEGWVPYAVADGRFLVPTVATAPPGLTAGTPLASGEDRTHTHGIPATFTVGSVSYAGIAGSGNDGVTAAGAVTLAATSEPASTGLPYVQLLVCRKNAAAVPGPTPLPHGLQMFFDMVACPVGWLQTAATQGRFIVGLPQGAPQDVAFGGAPVSSADGGVDIRTHQHPNTVTLQTTAHGIALVSGCCAGGYGADGTYTASMDTDSSATGLPYLELLSCEKQ